MASLGGKAVRVEDRRQVSSRHPDARAARRVVTATLAPGEVAERLMAALLKSAESKDFVGSNPTLSAT
jgi:hypothetical protein